MGFGLINFFFAFPAFYLIDTFGRRFLLLTTFPFMALFHGFTAIGYSQSGNTQIVLVTVGMYLFSVAYSPGEGPVPFVYAAESMPLYIRALGMSVVTAINWFFNSVIAITFPSLDNSLTAPGAFAYYAAWCVVGWVFILL
jgi:MFS family permease